MTDSPTADAVFSPRWERIAQSLRDDILGGGLAPGERLPNELVLAERFGVNRHTLRQAVQRLVQEGHLRVVQGKGTFVRHLVLDYALQQRTRMSQNLFEAGERGTRELLRHEVVEAGRWAAPLRLGRREPVLVLHTRTAVRGRPINLGQSVYPQARLGGMAEAFERTRSITKALEQCGIADYRRVSSTISARRPTADEADWLARAVTEPVLVVQHHSVDAEGRPVEAGTTLFAADAVQLTVAHAEGGAA